MEGVNTTGRRKSAVARIYVNEGKGQITVNDRDYKDYFTTHQLRGLIEQPLKLADQQGNMILKLILMVVVYPVRLKHSGLLFQEHL
jgi:small subunit ribosomal protein S9